MRGGHRRDPVATLAIFVILSLPASAQAANFYVDDDRGNDTNLCTDDAMPCLTVAGGVDKAVAASGPGDEILIDGGSYTENEVLLAEGNSLRELDFNPSDGDAQAVITSGPSGSAIRVEAAGAGGSPAGTIEGFDFVRAAGGGSIGVIYLNNDATVTGNTVTGISAETTGITIDGGSPSVSQNSVTSAAGGTGIAVGAGSPTISQNTLSGETFAISVGGGSPTISQNTITGISDPGPDNAATAIGVQSATATITGNSISSPADPSDSTTAIVVARFGGPLASATLARNRVSGHTEGVKILNASVTMNSDLAVANHVGLFAHSDPSGPAGSITAHNVTLYDNELAGFGAAGDVQVLANIDLVLNSSIVESPIEANSSSTCSISFSRGPTTAGTPCQQFQTTAAPGFVAPGSGDYHLAPLSPLIDAGDPAVPLAPNHLDLDGQARAQDGDCDGIAVRDVGADERGPRSECVPPDTDITTGPSDPTADSTPTFSFSSTEPGSSFECRFDTQAFVPCSGPGNSHTPASALTDGPRSFEVRAIDAAGNTDATPASRGFTVDTSPPNNPAPDPPADEPGSDPPPTAVADVDPPETTLTKQPKKRVETDAERVKAKFAFSSDEPGSSFDCKLDKGAFKPCDSGRLKRKVKSGRHKFLVRATDAAGNADPTPAKWRWKVVAE